MTGSQRAHKRLFFALWPDEPVRRSLTARTASLTTAAGGNAVAPANLHLTLAFLHAVDVERLAQVTAAAARAGRAVDAFQLTLSHVGYWPRSRILWLAPVAPFDALERLVANLWDELAECGFVPERRPFRPHVTLARNARAPRGTPALAPPVQWTVSDFVLVESLTGRARSTYEVLARWSLPAPTLE